MGGTDFKWGAGTTDLPAGDGPVGEILMVMPSGVTGGLSQGGKT